VGDKKLTIVNMSSISRKQAMIDLLSKFLAGSLSSSEALDAWPDIDDPTDDRLMTNAWHLLDHYDIDSDIRAREPAYEARQKADLQKMLDKLKSSLAK
jgi:hypothetical protein